MTGVFLQARLDSSRLPRKALLPLADRSVLEHAMRALLAVGADVYVLLTDEESSGELAPYAEREGFELFVGAKEDVLKRYADAARDFGVDRIIRATGDNPLVSGECARLICDLHRQEAADYSGFRGLPLGTGVECVETEALLEAEKLSSNRYYREHVCPFIYEHPERFIIHQPEAPREYRFPEGRVTLDTGEDYRRLQEIFRLAYEGKPVGIGSLVHILSQHHPIAG
jgi:spore coat polysaccharide biosynthesis protein SpsF